MISRRTSLAIAAAYTAKFSGRVRSRGGYGGSSYEDKVYYDLLYEFFYEREYEAWFCNASRRNTRIRALKDWFMKIHTGETLAKATPSWSWEQRQKIGQSYLKNLAGDFISWYFKQSDEYYKEKYAEQARELVRLIELDGFAVKDGELRQLEVDVLDVDQEKGLLSALYAKLDLGRGDEAEGFLELAEKHFVDGHWSDCIANCRKYLELTLQNVAIAFSHATGEPISEKALERPVEVRSYLENQGLVEKRERESLDKIYGLLSHTGSHPYMAEEDQARLLRQLSLTISQFVLLRLEGALQK